MTCSSRVAYVSISIERLAAAEMMMMMEMVMVMVMVMVVVVMIIIMATVVAMAKGTCMPVTNVGIKASTLEASTTLGERPGAAARKECRGPEEIVDEMKIANSTGNKRWQSRGKTAAASVSHNTLNIPTCVQVSEKASDALCRNIGLCCIVKKIHCANAEAASLLHFHDVRCDRNFCPTATVTAAVGTGICVVDLKNLLWGCFDGCTLLLLLFTILCNGAQQLRLCYRQGIENIK
jgi:hypothetical protein